MRRLQGRSRFLRKGAGLGLYLFLGLAVSSCTSVVHMQQVQTSMADIHLSNMFRNYMVLQRETKAPVWGQAQAGKTIRVSFSGQEKSALVDSKGNWIVWLDPMPASGEETGMTISYLADPGKPQEKLPEPIERSNILVGDVWFCSGQSNMEYGMSGIEDRNDQLKDAKYPNIRIFAIPKLASPAPFLNPDGIWLPANRENLTSGGWYGFSAVAFIFGRKIYNETHIPVGLIQSAFGGSPIDGWIAQEELTAFPTLKRYADAIQRADDSYAQALKKDPSAKHPWQGITEAADIKPGTLYHAMTEPVSPFAIKGILWYQGETDVGDGPLYTDKMLALIQTFRRSFNNKDLPFYFVQLPPWNYGGSNVLPGFWAAQEAVLAAPHTGMAGTLDVGDPNDVHPRRKKEVGERLALIALADTYGRNDIDPNGPVPGALDVAGPELRLSFDHAAGGLKTFDDAPLKGFEISEDGKRWIIAETRISGNQVLLSNPNLKDPKYLRYAWANLSGANLANAAGLPAKPFRRQL